MAGKQWQQWGKNQNKNQGWDAQGKGKAQQPKERGLPTHSNHENAQCWNSCGPGWWRSQAVGLQTRQTASRVLASNT